MLYRVKQFDGLVTPRFRQRHSTDHMGTGNALTSYQQLPSGNYYDYYGNTRSPQGLDGIVFEGELHAATHAALEADLWQWRSRLGKRGKLTIAVLSDALYWQWAHLVHVDPPSNMLQFLSIPLTLRWETAAQHWYQIIARPEAWSVGDNSFDLGDGTAEVGQAGTLTTLTSGLPQTLAIAHDGSSEAKNLRITLTPGVTTVTAFTVNNTTTDRQITHTGNVVSGEYLVLDTGASSAKLYGVSATIAALTNNFGSIRVRTDSAHGLATGERVLIAGLGAYDGEWPVSVVDSDEFDITTATFAIEPVAGATIRRVTNRYTNLSLSSRGQWMTLAAETDNSVTVTASGNSSGDATVGFLYYNHFA